MKMTDFEKQLLEGVEEMVAVKRGEKKATRRTKLESLKVAEIRKGLGMSQSQFAALLDVSKNTLVSWEHGTRNPSGPAKTLLLIAQKHPNVVLESIQ
jgi:putative transcriptional regulator